MTSISKSIQVFLVCVLIIPAVSAQESWSTDYVYYGMGGKLTYTPDEEGTIIPDFSHVGYRYGDEPIPIIENVVEVSPVNGDDGANIQAAIESLYLASPDANGFRGAVLLKAGSYHVEGQILVNASGIVIRGEGQGEDGTIVFATGTEKRALLEFGTSGRLSTESGSKVEVKENYVPVGRKYLLVTNAGAYSAGDQVAIYRPGTSQWISDIKMDQIPPRSDGGSTTQWTASGYNFYFERELTRVNGDTLFFRNPIVMALDKNYGGGFVYKASMNRIENVGVENICFKSEYASETDENHSWRAVQFNNVEHSWAKDVTAWYFALACVSVEADAKFISVLDCSCFEPKSIITGGRRYSFNCAGQMNLFKGCVTTEGRHDFSTSSRVRGPNVFTDCKASNAHSDIGPHHRWAMGTLYDVIESDNAINVQDRSNLGSGHGWAGANQVLWNCKANASACQSPWVSAKNYNFGFQGTKKPGFKPDRPDGVWIGHNKTGIFPHSLYEAQLKDRQSSALVFSALHELVAVSGSSFRMTFNLPLKTSTVVKENFVIGGSAGLEDEAFTVELHDAHHVDIVFSEIGFLPSFSTITVTAENVLSEDNLIINGLHTSFYTEPDQRPVVSGPYDMVSVTNESGSFAVLESTKLGWVYLIRMGEPSGTKADFETAFEAKKAVRAEVTEVNVSIPLYTQGIYGGAYLMYAIDEDGRVSLPGYQIVMVEEIIRVGVENMVRSQHFSLVTDRESVYIHPSRHQESYKVRIYDVNGRVIFSSLFLRGSQQIELKTNQLMIVKIMAANVIETHKLMLVGEVSNNIN